MTSDFNEKSNYISILLLTTDIGTDVYRDVLKTRCKDGVSYADFFNNNKDKIKPRLNFAQKKVLFPKNGTFSGNLQELDISLLYALLRNACSIIPPSTGWGQPPKENDREMSANIERIHLIRNRYVGHSPTARINECEFQREFKNLVQSIILLGGQHYTDRILEIMNEKYEREELCMLKGQIKIALTELRNQTAIENEELETMRKTDKRFINTKVAEKAYKTLSVDQMLIICGTPGTGKTSTAFHSAFKMADENGYSIHLAKEPQDIKKYASEKKKEIYIFDDVCGKFYLNGSIVNLWEHYEEEINLILKLRKNLKVIMISRAGFDIPRIFKHFDAFKEDNVIYTTLSLVERRTLCESYLSENVTELLDDETLLKFKFFPLLCKIFSQKEDKQQVQMFFSSPVQIIHDELKMMKEKDPLAFLSLAVLVVLSNSITIDLFRPENKRLKQVAKSICFECELLCNPLPHLIKQKFEMLKDSYIIKTKTEIRAVHDKMFDIIVQFFGKLLINTILTHGESAFITTRLQLKLLGDSENYSIILIPNEAEDMYFETIRHLLNTAKCWNVFGNHQSKSIKYRKRFVEYLRTQRDIAWKICDTDGASPLFVSAFCGYYEYCEYILEQEESLIHKCDEFGRSPLYAASRNGYAKIAHLLLGNGADANMMSLQNISPLHRSQANKNITYLLLLYGGDVNQRGWKQRTPLHFACEEGKEELVQCLIDHRAEINSFDEDYFTPLDIARHFGHQEIAQLLVRNGAALKAFKKNGLSPDKYLSKTTKIRCVQNKTM